MRGGFLGRFGVVTGLLSSCPDLPPLIQECSSNHAGILLLI